MIECHQVDLTDLDHRGPRCAVRQPCAHRPRHRAHGAGCADEHEPAPRTGVDTSAIDPDLAGRSRMKMMHRHVERRPIGDECARFPNEPEMTIDEQVEAGRRHREFECTRRSHRCFSLPSNRVSEPFFRCRKPSFRHVPSMCSMSVASLSEAETMRSVIPATRHRDMCRGAPRRLERRSRARRKTGWMVETAPRIIDVNDAIASRHGGVLLAGRAGHGEHSSKSHGGHRHDKVTLGIDSLDAEVPPAGWRQRDEERAVETSLSPDASRCSPYSPPGRQSAWPVSPVACNFELAARPPDPSLQRLFCIERRRS